MREGKRKRIDISKSGGGLITPSSIRELKGARKPSQFSCSTRSITTSKLTSSQSAVRERYDRCRFDQKMGRVVSVRRLGVSDDLQGNLEVIAIGLVCGIFRDERKRTYGLTISALGTKLSSSKSISVPRLRFMVSITRRKSRSALCLFRVHQIRTYNNESHVSPIQQLKSF